MKFYETKKDALQHLKTIAPKDRAIVPFIRLITRESGDRSLNLNGGDYDRWLNCELVSPGLYRAVEDWSAEWSILDYCHLDGYVVIEQGEDLSPSSACRMIANYWRGLAQENGISVNW